VFTAWHVRSAAGRTRPQLVAATAPAALAATTNELTSPAEILFLVLAAFAGLLVVVGVVAVPARVLPARVAAAVDGRREQLMFVALCALSLGFVLVFFVALGSS
jgi:hypothetical protein